MTSGCDTPVALFVFNRVATLRRLLAVLGMVRPKLVLIVADGPRPEHRDDAARCAAVRALVERMDWPCEVRRHYADTNLGCDPRIASGIGWVLDQVDEAIFLEDDLLPDPSFFAWCAAMLARYRDDVTAMQVVGRNELVRWGGTEVDHHLIWRVSPLGWATWRRAWQAAGRVALPGDPSAIDDAAASGALDPLVAEHFAMLHALARRGALRAWDCEWALRRAMLGGLSVVPPVNLVAHDIFDSEATHNRFGGDIRGLQPAGRAPRLTGARRARPDLRLDRWSLLLDLAATYRNHAVLGRLARARTLVGDGQVRHHLAPFAAAAETLAALRHLRGHATDPAALDPLIDLMQRAATAPDARPA